MSRLMERSVSPNESEFLSLTSAVRICRVTAQGREKISTSGCHFLLPGPHTTVYNEYALTSDSSNSLDDDSTSMGVGPVELSLRDVLSVPATLALFLRPISLDPDSLLLSASDNLFVFNLSV